MQHRNILKVKMPKPNNYKKSNNKSFVLSNDQIRHPEVRVSFPDGESRILSLKDAMYEATKEGLDLVLIADNATPPVCKITDASKHIYAHICFIYEHISNIEIIGLLSGSLSLIS